MSNKNSLIVFEKDSLKSAMIKMKRNGTRTVVVSDSKKFLLGTLSEGDIQKALIKNKNLNTNIKKIYNKKPKKILDKDYDFRLIKKIFIDGQFGLIPIVNNSNKIIKLITWDDIFNPDNEIDKLKNIEIIVMAGGKGERLRP